MRVGLHQPDRTDSCQGSHEKRNDGGEVQVEIEDDKGQGDRDLVGLDGEEGDQSIRQEDRCSQNADLIHIREVVMFEHQVDFTLLPGNQASIHVDCPSFFRPR